MPKQLRNYHAPRIVREGFDLNEALFAGFEARTKKYDKSSWAFEFGDGGNAAKDMTLEHSRCVFQLLAEIGS